jgi:hypothetical protein
VSAAGLDRARMQPLAPEKASGKANRPKFQASRGNHLALLAHQDLGTASTNVNEYEALIKDWNRLQHTDMNESSLFHPSDYIDNNAGLVTRSVDKDISIFGFTNGTRCDRYDICIVNSCNLH